MSNIKLVNVTEEIEEVGWKSINELAFIEHVYPEDAQLLVQYLIKS